MNPTQQARTALEAQGIPAATDRQLEQVVSRAALVLVAGELRPFDVAAAQVAEESR